jgi:hypothetical protein
MIRNPHVDLFGNSHPWDTLSGGTSDISQQDNFSLPQSLNSAFYTSSDLFSVPDNFDSFSNSNKVEPDLISNSSSFSSMTDFLEPRQPSIDSLSNLGTGFAGALIGSAVKSISDSTNQSNITKAAQGLGPNGHAFDADYHAQQLASHNSTMASIESAEIGLGSMLGPEGLVAGVALAGVTSLVGDYTAPSQNTTMSTSGQLVNAANFS